MHDKERALISNYNKLVCSSRVTLSDGSVQVIHSAARRHWWAFLGYKNDFFS